MEKKHLNLLKVAVTGHRFINHKSIIINSVHQLFTEFSNNNVGSEIHLYSALAEGSDQLVAIVAKEYQHIKLIVPLPLSIDDYLRDFESQKAKQNFHKLLNFADNIIYLPTIHNHQTAYQNLGKFLIKECDYLIAIWNGIFTNKKGGTGEVIKMAIELKKPVYWIFSNKDNEIIDSHFRDVKLLGEIEIINQI